MGAAEVKRLGVAAGAGSGHGGPARGAASSGHQGQREVRQLLNDPRGQAMGLGHLQEAVRQSFEVLQHALQRPSPQPTLLDPLLRPGDQGVREFTPVPDSEFIQSGMEAERMGASPYMAVADVMIYILACWIPILPHRWDLWGR